MQEETIVLSPEDKRIILKAIEVVRDSFSRAHFLDISASHRAPLAVLINRFAKFLPHLKNEHGLDVEKEMDFEREVELFAHSIIDSFDSEAVAFQIRQRQADFERSVKSNAVIRAGSLYRDCRDTRHRREKLAQSSFELVTEDLRRAIEYFRKREEKDSVFYGIASGAGWHMNKALHRALQIISRDKDRSLILYAQNPAGYVAELRHTPSKLEMAQGPRQWSELLPDIRAMIKFLEGKAGTSAEARTAHEIGAFLRRVIIDGQVFTQPEVDLISRLIDEESAFGLEFNKLTSGFDAKKERAWERWRAYEALEDDQV